MLPALRNTATDISPCIYLCVYTHMQTCSVFDWRNQHANIKDCADRCFSKYLAKHKNAAWERCKCFQIWGIVFLFKPMWWLLSFLGIRNKTSLPAAAAFKMSWPKKTRARQLSSKAHHYLIDASHESLNHYRRNEKGSFKS